MSNRQYSRPEQVRDEVVGAVLVIVTLAFIFSYEYPILASVSQYASINTEDIGILVIFVLFCWSLLRRADWNLTLLLPRTTALISLLTGWIVVTHLAAFARSPDTVAASSLWVLKWVEGVVLFVSLQHILTRRRGELMVRSLFLSGTLLACYAVFKAIGGYFRVRFFFNNPNTLASFFILIAVIGGAHLVCTRERRFVPAVAITAGSIGVFATGSRSGILGLVVALAVLLLLVHRHLKRAELSAIGGLAAVGIASIPFVIPPRVRGRLVSWITYKNGTVVITDVSFTKRFELVQKSIDLFLNHPVLGHGWFASPSRVGYLDVYYSILLVELGAVGFVLMLFFSLFLIRAWLSMRETVPAIGCAGAAWYIGLLAQAIGGGFPRAPQVMFITLLFVAASRALRLEDG